MLSEALGQARGNDRRFWLLETERKRDGEREKGQTVLTYQDENMI